MSRIAPWLARSPFVAILRGVRPEEVVPIAQAVVEAGWCVIEVPLNSPAPFASIARLSEALAADILVGAGTVRTPAEVDRVAEAGGRLIVMPHADVAVIRHAARRGLMALPGVFTATDTFAAIDAGADALKLFPAEIGGPALLKALRAVLPQDLPVLPVGGVAPDTVAAWRAAGAAGFGVGSALYRPGDDAAMVGRRARAFVAALG
ncbi:2-dehydro-3-deoxy-6-phosphogalactonate aldolase [Elioraea sp. Yellowstone]|jgi:2-dehydro-3-deoxyphosphogalactonate aldolase|uniref:2-dehydro-3-deoxy-6-phosphogalactonate aldolase n=1 Tax=Elioraea sp. Yellowstone TaxID=2592070 RepID=UPI00114F1824|nr:2-dehydro-3-deoxy-6-phosphogalactonate aldolase [Elioraea sp. Yellowstone]TQF83727.1 2-dehydro-3-deoxy-6-phosphogalactonate aldolase [Elioraea sp. Yellowstone]